MTKTDQCSGRLPFSGRGEDNYQSLYGSLQQLTIPFLLTFGEAEHTQFGSFRFYDYLGPYFFSFSVGEAGFIFLDVTGKTPHSWQGMVILEAMGRRSSRGGGSLQRHRRRSTERHQRL
jgi:hypothetical protein